MGFQKFIGTSVFQIFSLTFVAAFLLGILNLYFSDKTNYCEMTYMFEYPQFVRISVTENIEQPQYGLYAYSEGRYTEKARKMWFDGIPVLYIPGNAGSHMQARSIASVALRKAVSKGYEYHFDFFTISFNEELSALYGGVLQSQTQFTSACIAKILSLYKNNKYTKNIPQTVILIGHSMGGVIAKRLLAYPSTINLTNIAITLAAPLHAPIINYDPAIDDYYKLTELEWDRHISKDISMKEKKILISLGSGPRDILVPASFTSSEGSTVSALTTSVPGVWTSPDHVSIVWCKQLVLAINRYLFSIVSAKTDQIVNDHQLWKDQALRYFKANRSMSLDPQNKRPEVSLLADGFWYEDNRRIYQISRPEIDRMTYLMIRLVSFPQNRFVAIETANHSDKDWVFGCNAKYASGSYRYCKEATSLTELSRWSGAASKFGRRKLATVHLHDLMDSHPEWTHVVVRVPPTRKPITLNVDINDHASRRINIDLPSEFSFGKYVVKDRTEPHSIYYELVLPGFNTLHQSYLLYVEPIDTCKASQYHVSAEFHVPWADNHEYFHYFTHLKRTPMKLRLFKSNPNVTRGVEATQHVTITLLLDPQCSYTISISTSWYHRLAQLVRNYSSVLYAYIAAILLLAARSNIINLKDKGTCVSIHNALMSESVKPYYALPLARLGIMMLTSFPFLNLIFEPSTWKNAELQYFVRSLLVLPAYMTALGILNVLAMAILVMMVFWSQLAHRLLFRIMWRGGSSLAEKVATGLQKVPAVVTAALVLGAPISCGAAALAAGAAFYAFMLSKLYEEYLEDYFYKLLARIGSKMCYFLKRKSQREKEKCSETKNLLSIADSNSEITSTETEINSHELTDSKEFASSYRNATEENNEAAEKIKPNDGNEQDQIRCTESNRDEELNNLNFHMLMFLLWLTVTLANLPALLTWARNFKYSVKLIKDTSFHTGLTMAICSASIWQTNGPRRHLKYYEALSSLLFTMAVFILALGPFSVAVVNYGVTFMFAVITIQQLCDTELPCDSNQIDHHDGSGENNVTSQSKNNESDQPNEKVQNEESEETGGNNPSESEQPKNKNSSVDDCDVCNESRIYNAFKTIKEKLGFEEGI